MKYQPTFDQVACVDMDYSSLDGLLLDLIVNAPVWAQKINYNGEDYYFLSQSKIMEELPSVFHSKPSVTRAVNRLEEVLSVHRAGRSNFYKIDPRLSAVWGKKNKGEEYQEFIAELFRKRNSSRCGTIPDVELNSSDNGTIPPQNSSTSGTYKTTINKPTKINQPTRTRKNPSKDQITGDQHANASNENQPAKRTDNGTSGRL